MIEAELCRKWSPVVKVAEEMCLSQAAGSGENYSKVNKRNGRAEFHRDISSQRKIIFGKVSQTLEIILVFEENVQNAEMNLNCNWTEIKRQRQMSIPKSESNLSPCYDDEDEADIGNKKW